MHMSNSRNDTSVTASALSQGQGQDDSSLFLPCDSGTTKVMLLNVVVVGVVLLG